jgi:ketosteroid isomerase-like protein/quercetin dioxygenase-like cupin family protein
MRRSLACVVLLVVSAGCGSTVNVAQEREALLALDREFSTTAKDPNKFITYFAPDASAYPPGMPIVTGTSAIRDLMTQMTSAPGFSLEWTPTKAEVSASGDIGYTTGTYRSSMAGVAETGKYVSVWTKQPGGAWKVKEDIFNADASGAPPSAHLTVDAGSIVWGDPPPALPTGAKVAVISGDPSKPGPFVIRIQFPAGYKVAPHWHPVDENVTLLAGTMSVGMGETWDDTKMQAFTAGSYVVLPAQSRHYVVAKTAATIQIGSTGPFVINYVNPADDPSKAK